MWPLSEDTYKDKGARRLLVQLLAEKGINDQAVLAAIETVPRHLLLESAFQHLAYQDKAIPIKSNQTMSQPYTVARQTELLEVKHGHKVLEIGTGSGYQACILAEMGAIVHTIEYHERLFNNTFENLKKFNYHIQCYHGDGSMGLLGPAPFDRIIVTAGAPYLPIQLMEQLVVGGMLVIPVGEQKVQTMVRITRKPNGTYFQEDFETYKFVPLRGLKGWG